MQLHYIPYANKIHKVNEFAIFDIIFNKFLNNRHIISPLNNLINYLF
jgi:hypothetical protein